MFCCWMFFQRALWIHKRVFRDNDGRDLIGKRFPKLVMAISYVQMLVSFEHVVAAMVSELPKEKDTVLSRSLC